jgi:hypothetical protein
LTPIPLIPWTSTASRIANRVTTSTTQPTIISLHQAPFRVNYQKLVQGAAAPVHAICYFCTSKVSLDVDEQVFMSKFSHEQVFHEQVFHEQVFGEQVFSA